MIQAIAAVVAAFAAILGSLYVIVTRPITARLDDVIRRLDRIETLFAGHDERITRLEERTSPLCR